MKVLVTGGAGFIGSHLVEKLVKEDNEVIVLDNLHTGSLKNLEEFLGKIEIMTKPFSGVLDLELNGLDGIFHFGIPSSSPMYKENPYLVGEAINEFIKILGLAKIKNCKVVFASSSSIYNGNQTPWKEDCTIKVMDFYTEARYAMERLAMLYYQLYGVESIGLRFFSVYGPKEECKKNYANLVSQFIWAMNKNEQPVIFGDGSQKRDFIYVRDVVHACLLSMTSKTECDVFNVGTGRCYTLNELVDLLNRLLNISIEPKYVENPIKNYVQNTLADTTKANEELGFVAEYTLEEGIKEILRRNWG